MGGAEGAWVSRRAACQAAWVADSGARSVGLLSASRIRSEVALLGADVWGGLPMLSPKQPSDWPGDEQSSGGRGGGEGTTMSRQVDAGASTPW